MDFTLGIGYADDMDKAIATVEKVISEDPRPLAEPAAQIVVGELADSSVNLIVRIWVKADDYWPLKFDLTKRFKESFDTEGISIPYPQQDVYLHRVGGDA